MQFLTPGPGTYAIVFQCDSTAMVQIGRRLQMDLKPGYYIYVGSAFGPGGVGSRVARHLRKTKSCHWHLDYLREFVTPAVVWYSHDPERLEHRWALALAGMEGIYPVHGFGCTDCKCHSHLFRTETFPQFSRFSRALGGNILSVSLYPAP